MENTFPLLKASPYELTSPCTINYNCIAWAAGDNETWWWPDPFNQYYWPEEIPREETIEAFIKAFDKLGYKICKDSTYETGYEKIVIYAKSGGKPTHAARQIDSTKWTSKIGRLYDIEHEINSLSGDVYGEPIIFMKRPK